MIGRLNRYIIGRFAIWLGITGTAFGAIAMLGDFLEMLRLTNRFDLGAGDAFYFTMLRLPLLLIDFLPFIFLFSAVFCLLRMSQAQELAVIRAAGVSVWQFLSPILAFTFITASLIVAFMEPLGTATYTRFTELKTELSGTKPKLSFSKGGVWFRENTQNGNYIIHAEKFDADAAERLLNVEVTLFEADNSFAGRIEAESAILDIGRFVLTNARNYSTNAAAGLQPELTLPSSLAPEGLNASFVSARAVNIWQLPGYIERASLTGIDVTRHHVRLQSLLALPLLLMAMVMVAACFSLPTGRMISTGQTIGLAVLSGFLLFLFNDLTQLLGELGSVPPLLASWTPAIIAMLLAISYLLSTEDG